MYSSEKQEKKVVWVEDTFNPLTAPPEIFNPTTYEFVTAFKGLISNSFYANRDILSRRLNVIFTKKWGPPI